MCFCKHSESANDFLLFVSCEWFVRNGLHEGSALLWQNAERESGFWRNLHFFDQILNSGHKDTELLQLELHTGMKNLTGSVSVCPAWKLRSTVVKCRAELIFEKLTFFWPNSEFWPQRYWAFTVRAAYWYEKPYWYNISMSLYQYFLVV